MGKFLLVVAVAGVLVYGLFWLVERRRARRSGRGPASRGTPPRRSLGPDDDEDFLRQLEQRRRRAAREKKPDEPERGDGRPDQPKPE